MSIAAVINEKFRERVPAWEVIAVHTLKYALFFKSFSAYLIWMLKMINKLVYFF